MEAELSERFIMAFSGGERGRDRVHGGIACFIQSRGRGAPRRLTLSGPEIFIFLFYLADNSRQNDCARTTSRARASLPLV